MLDQFLGFSPGAPVHSEEKPHAGSVDALKLLQRLRTRPLLRWLIRLPSDDNRYLLYWYETVYPQLIIQSSPRISNVITELSEEELSSILDHPVEVSDNLPPGRLAMAITENGQQKEIIHPELLIFAGNDTEQKKIVCSWIFSRRQAYAWIQKHPRNPVTWLLSHVAKRLSGRNDDERMEFAAGLLCAVRLPPLNFYARLRRRFRTLSLVPAVPVQRILKEFDEHHRKLVESERILAHKLISMAYRQMEENNQSRIYKSGESFAAYATRLALTAAQLGQDAGTIMALLLHQLESPALKNMELVFPDVVDLINGLNALDAEPFRPPLVTEKPDSTIEALLNRQLALLDELARGIVDKRLPAGNFTEEVRSRRIRAVRASLFAMALADRWQTLATINPENPSPLTVKTRAEMELLYIPQAQRLLLGPLAEVMKNEYYRVFAPDRHAQIRNDMDQALGMTPEQTGDLLHTLERDMTNVLNIFGVRADVHGARKSDRSAERRLTRRLKTNSEARISDQTDLLSLRIVVDTDEDLKKAEDLDLLLGTRGKSPDGWTQISPAWKRLRFGHSIKTIEVEHPNNAAGRQTIEIQMLTRAAQEDYLRNRHQADHDLPLYQHTLRIAAADYASWAFGREDDPVVLEFTEKDRPLVSEGDVAEILEENLERLTKAHSGVYPLVPVNREGKAFDPTAIAQADVSECFWAAVRLPEGATMADLIFSRWVAGAPSQYPAAVETVLEKTSPRGTEKNSLSIQTGSGGPASDPAESLRRPLGRAPIIFIDADRSLDISSAEAKTLFPYAQTPRARSLLYHASDTRDTRPLGRKSIEDHFGTYWSTLKTTVLGRLVHALDFATAKELVEAVGAGTLSLNDPQIDTAYHRHFTRISPDIVSHGDRLRITLRPDQRQAGFLHHALKSLTNDHWRLGNVIRVDEDEEGVYYQIDVHKDPSKNIKDSLKKIRLERSYKPWQGTQESRLIRIQLASPDQLIQVTGVLAKNDIEIQHLSYLFSNQDGATYELELAGPGAQDTPETHLPPDLETELMSLTKNHQISYYMQFHFEPLQDGAGPETRRLAFTTDENQLGILADLTDIIVQHGWELTGYFQQRETRAGGRATLFDMRPDRDAASEENLMAALKDYRRERGSRPPEEKGQWLSVRLVLRNVPGAIREVARTFAILDTYIESGNLESVFPGSGIFNFIVFAPQSLKPQDLGKRFRQHFRRLFDDVSSPLLDIRVSQTDVGDETAAELSRILKEHRSATEQGYVARIKHARPMDQRVNWKYVRLFETAIELMYRYHGYPDKSIPHDGRVAAWQGRKSDPSGRLAYAVHPQEVAQIYLNEFQGRDETFLLVCLLHDVLEDAPKNVYRYYNEMMKAGSWEATLAEIRQRFPADQYPDLAKGLETAQRLTDLRSLIVQAAIQEISREIEETFGPRLLEVLRLYDHSRSSFKKSIESLSGKDIADFLAAKGADQVSNLATAFQAGNLEKTLSKLVRHLLPAMALDPSRRTTVYYLSRIGLLKALTRAAENSKQDWPLFQNEVEGEGYTESARDAQMDTIKSGSQVLVMMRENPEFLKETNLDDIERFEALIRRHVKTQVSKVIQFPEPSGPTIPGQTAALTGHERRDARWISWMGAAAGGCLGFQFASDHGWFPAPGLTPDFMLPALILAGLWALASRLSLSLSEWMHEWRGHIAEMHRQGFTRLDVIRQPDGGLEAIGQIPADGEVDWHRIWRAGPLQNARLLAVAAIISAGLVGPLNLIPIALPATHGPAFMTAFGLSGMTAFIGSQILINLRLRPSDNRVLFRDGELHQELLEMQSA